MASKIDPGLAQSLIKEFQEQNGTDGGPSVKTIEGHNLHGYFLDRESLEEILKDPNATGVTLSHAKHPDAAGTTANASTLVYTAAVPGASPEAVSAQAMFASPTCPPVCFP